MNTVSMSPEERDKLQRDQQRQLVRRLKSSIYHWQPLNFDEYRSKVYLATNFASQYAMLVQIFNEVREKVFLSFFIIGEFRSNNVKNNFILFDYSILVRARVQRCGKSAPSTQFDRFVFSFKGCVTSLGQKNVCGNPQCRQVTGHESFITIDSSRWRRT